MPTGSAVPVGVFLDSLFWLDGARLHIETYRRRLFDAFASRDPRGHLLYNLALCGRAKKNNKTLDGMLQAMYCLFDESPQGSQVYVVANDEDQAADDLDLLKKLFRVNRRLDGLVRIQKHRIERRDGEGFIQVLPAQDVVGQHGKSYRFCATTRSTATGPGTCSKRCSPTRRGWMRSSGSLATRASSTGRACRCST